MNIKLLRKSITHRPIYLGTVRKQAHPCTFAIRRPRTYFTNLCTHFPRKPKHHIHIVTIKRLLMIRIMSCVHVEHLGQQLKHYSHSEIFSISARMKMGVVATHRHSIFIHFSTIRNLLGKPALPPLHAAPLRKVLHTGCAVPPSTLQHANAQLHAIQHQCHCSDDTHQRQLQYVRKC